jgi:hypothetical protein
VLANQCELIGFIKSEIDRVRKEICYNEVEFRTKLTDYFASSTNDDDDNDDGKVEYYLGVNIGLPK